MRRFDMQCYHHPVTTQFDAARRDRHRVIGVLLHDFQLGGAERVAIRLASAWSRLGCRVILFTGGGGGAQRQLLDSEIQVITADPPIPRSAASALRLARWMAATGVARGVDVFYLPGNSYFRCIGTLSAASGARIYATITNSLWRSDRSRLRNVVFGMLTRARLRKVKGAISMSPALLRQERAVLGPLLDMCALPNALFEDVPEPAIVARRPWHLCAVGRLVPQKNFALLLRSLALLRDLPFTLSIAGDGWQRAGLQQLAVTLGIAERVRFLGEVAGSAECLAEAEVMVMTSDYEGYPAVAVEALAAGCFVVSSNCSVAMADILPAPELGTIVNGHRPEDFAAALRQYLTAPMKPPPAHRLIRARPLLQSHVVAEAARRYLEFMGLAVDDAGDPLQAARSPVAALPGSAPAAKRSSASAAR